MHIQLTNQNTIVTGGTKGIGQAITHHLLKTGARVLATYAGDKQGAEDFAQKMKEEGFLLGEHLFLDQLNIGNQEQIQEFLKRTKELSVFADSGLQIMINNAGISKDNLSLMQTQDEWQQCMHTNIDGTFALSKAAANWMLENRYGRLINITSVAARLNINGQCAYSTTKAAVNAMTKSMAVELARKKITVNAVAPGFIDTAMLGHLEAEQLQSFKKTVPMRRFGKVEEVASAVAFLASEHASYITGHILDVAGGL